jgi:hypothetical protein
VSADAAAKIGGVAATYCLEHLGGTYHSYTWDEFEARYRQHFGHADRSELGRSFRRIAEHPKGAEERPPPRRSGNAKALPVRFT